MKKNFVNCFLHLSVSKYQRNGSADLTGVFNVYTGQQDIKKLGQMFSWNYKRHLGFFESYCGFANGSAGEFQPPNLTPKSIVKLFTPDICRTIPLDYKETQIVEGIKGYKYAGGQRSIDNGTFLSCILQKSKYIKMISYFFFLRLLISGEQMFLRR